MDLKKLDEVKAAEFADRRADPAQGLRTIVADFRANAKAEWQDGDNHARDIWHRAADEVERFADTLK